MSESDSILGILPSRSITSSDASLSITDACKLVNSGDLVLFSDKSWSASLITLTCPSRFSHVGIIFRPRGGIPYLLEAVYHEGKDVDVRTNAPKSGVRLIDFKTHLQHFSGKSVAIRLVRTKETLCVASSLNRHMTEILDNIQMNTRDLPYETGVIDFLLSRFPIVEKKSENMDKFFCSKLVAYCYIEAGLLDITAIPSSFLPDDFSETGDVSLQYPAWLRFPGFESSFSNIIKFSNELYINTHIL